MNDDVNIIELEQNGIDLYLNPVLVSKKERVLKKHDLKRKV